MKLYQFTPAEDRANVSWDLLYCIASSKTKQTLARLITLSGYVYTRYTTAAHLHCNVQTYFSQEAVARTTEEFFH